ncbi:MAG TPA: hypothetical protein VGL94_14165 [Ktedonobacteraceae bacterium]|jgi:hypothetical protein
MTFANLAEQSKLDLDEEASFVKVFALPWESLMQHALLSVGFKWMGEIQCSARERVT